MAKSSRKKYGSGNRHQTRQAGILDDLQEFSRFREEILPVLREALSSGMSAEDIHKKFQAYAAARIVSIAAMEPDSSKALAAAKDIMDRAGGRATEKQEVVHKFDQVPDDQLDALILSKLKKEASALTPIETDTASVDDDEDEVDVYQ